MRVAVAGGTGTVGKYVVDALRDSGHEVTVLSRSRGVDLTTGAGADDALRGADTVIDVSNGGRGKRSATRFIDAATGTLQAASQRAAVAHYLALSIVGIDRVPTGYYSAKLHQEELITAGALPYTILRATQFHELAAQILRQMPGPIAIIPRWRVQTIAAREVGQALARLATEPPAGRAADLAGPEVHDLADLARRYLRHRGSRRPVISPPVPGKLGRALRSGSLPQQDGPRGSQTFEQWLAGPDAEAIGG